MTIVIVDYGSGNLHSVEKSFRRMADSVGAGDLCLTGSAEEVAGADKVILPGVGAFAACKEGLADRGLSEAVAHATVNRGVPFLGICVGMQLLATTGLEHGESSGFGWIPGCVEKILPDDARLKIPHMGWNEIDFNQEHPLFAGLKPSANLYFVHSYKFVPEDPAHAIARTDYGGSIAAAVGRDNILGVQFHPEKSQTAGLRIISNFLQWRP